MSVGRIYLGTELVFDSSGGAAPVSLAAAAEAINVTAPSGQTRRLFFQPSADDPDMDPWASVEDEIPFSITGLTASTEYRVHDGAAPQLVTAQAAATVPGQVLNLQATGGDEAVDLTWGAPASNGGSAITGYRIERRIDEGSWTEIVEDTGTTATSYTDEPLANGLLHEYRVSARNAVGVGAPSDVAGATPGVVVFFSRGGSGWPAAQESWPGQPVADSAEFDILQGAFTTTTTFGGTLRSTGGGFNLIKVDSGFLTFPANQRCEVTQSGLQNNYNDHGPAVRVFDNGTTIEYYFLWYFNQSDRYEIRYMNGGTTTTVAESDVLATPEAGDRMDLRIIGSAPATLEARLNGTLIASGTHTGNTEGQPGYTVFSTDRAIGRMEAESL